MKFIKSSIFNSYYINKLTIFKQNSSIFNTKYGRMYDQVIYRIKKKNWI